MCADMCTDDVTALTQLVLHERLARDRSWWDVMRACYAEDSSVRLSWFSGTGADFVAASEQMAGRGDSSTHRLAPPIVDVAGDRALVVVPAVIEVRTDLDGVEVDLSSYARLLYRAQRSAAGWRIVALDPVYERDTLTPTVQGTAPAISAADLAGLRAPYRMLTYVLSRRGYQIAQDLNGDDRPEAVRALEKAAQDWLHA
jgi:hypothetical protein